MKHREQSIVIYENDSKPYGIPYVKWIVFWWKWLISIARPSNPALDDIGEFCGLSQSNRHVWFLAGTFGGSVNRSCTIPYGKAILLPIINCEFSFADEPSIKTERELERRCRIEIDKIGPMYSSLNGEAIDVRNCRVQSRCFSVKMIPDNCLCGVIGETKMASDGYWLFIKPLPRGYHVLTSFGSCLAGRVKIGSTYRLFIK